MPGTKDPEQIIEDVVNEIDSEADADALTRGTEVYEEEAGYEEEDEPAELDFEPEGSRYANYDYDRVSDAYVGEDDF